MDANRLSQGQLVAAIAAIALFIISFLPWFGISGAVTVGGTTIGGSQNFNLWEAENPLDIYLLIVILVALCRPRWPSGRRRRRADGVDGDRAPGRCRHSVDPLPAFDTPGEFDRKVGLFLGLIAAPDRGRRLSVDAGGRRRRAVLTQVLAWRAGRGRQRPRPARLSFLPWYSAQGDNATAWQAFSVVDLFIAAAAVAGLAVGIVVLGRISVSYPVAGSAVAPGGALALLLIAYRLINPPGADGVEREIGAWLGLLAAAGITYGGYLGMQEPRPVRNPSVA